MPENQKYYYMRLKEGFFESNEMTVLESMKDGYLYSNILLKLYLRSLRDEGRLMFNNTIPFDAPMIATITRHQVGTVERALRIFQEMGLIEILDTGAIYMLNIQNYIGQSSTEADRQRRYQKRITAEKTGLLPASTTGKKSNKKSNTVADCEKSNKISTPEIEKETETEKKTETKQEEEEEKESSKVSLLLPTSEEGHDFVIYRTEVENLSRRFPGLDVEEALGKLKDWLSRHPEKQKPRNGTHEIMDRWLSACYVKVKNDSSPSPYEELENAELWLPDFL